LNFGLAASMATFFLGSAAGLVSALIPLIRHEHLVEQKQLGVKPVNVSTSRLT